MTDISSKQNKKIKALLTSKTRLKILKLFYNRRDHLFVRQICREVEEEINAVRRELKNLYQIGFLERKPKGNRLYYRLNKNFEFYPDFSRIMAKTSGLGQEIISKKEEIGGITFACLSLAFFYGRVASRQDIDLFIVGRPRLKLLANMITEFEKKYHREINYSVMTLSEFENRKKQKDDFIRKILSEPQVFLLGEEINFYH